MGPNLQQLKDNLVKPQTQILSETKSLDNQPQQPNVLTTTDESLKGKYTN